MKHKKTFVIFGTKASEGGKSINVVWYDGEPLIAKEIVFSMSDSIKNYVKSMAFPCLFR